MESPLKAQLDVLEQAAVLQEWKKQNSGSFLSHFFVPISARMEPKSAWEVGFYSPEKNKITTFVLEKQITQKAEDDVFKRDETKVEALAIRDVSLSFEQAVQKCLVNLPKFFAGVERGDGFAVLQTLKEKTLWNFSFITKALQFINLKINAKTGDVESHESIELVQK